MLKVYQLIVWGMLGFAFVIFVLFFYLVLKERVLASRWMKKRRLKWIVKHKRFESIQMIAEEPEPGFGFPLSITDVEDFVQEARRKRPAAVQGVETIRLRNRPDALSLSVYGACHSFQSYRSSQGATIDLYPLSKDGEYYRMYPFYKDLEKRFPVQDDIQDRPYILITEEQAKKELLHTLGHEFGHSLIYNLDKKLHGDDIERQCNAWAKQFGCETLSYADRKKYMVYKGGMKIGTLEEVV